MVQKIYMFSIFQLAHWVGGYFRSELDCSSTQYSSVSCSCANMDMDEWAPPNRKCMQSSVYRNVGCVVLVSVCQLSTCRCSAIDQLHSEVNLIVTKLGKKTSQHNSDCRANKWLGLNAIKKRGNCRLAEPNLMHVREPVACQLLHWLFFFSQQHLIQCFSGTCRDTQTGPCYTIIANNRSWIQAMGKIKL